MLCQTTPPPNPQLVRCFYRNVDGWIKTLNRGKDIKKIKDGGMEKNLRGIFGHLCVYIYLLFL